MSTKILQNPRREIWEDIQLDAGPSFPAAQATNSDVVMYSWLLQLGFAPDSGFETSVKQLDMLEVDD